MFSTDFIFRQQENLVDNQKCQAGFRPLCNKILLWSLNPGDRICRGAGMNFYHASLLEDIYIATMKSEFIQNKITMM